ncbi:MAG: TetR/AcrR family transcriptional regulator [Desulfobacterales bacterium]|nr:TetR/AcrR family transcriptional regulator [Desulfobacterales bacterium]
MQQKKLERKKKMEALVRNDIIESAIELLLELGNKKFTMDRVAAGAGIAKGTVYLYFKNKDDLIKAVVAHCFAPLEEAYQRIINGKSAPGEKLKQCIHISLEMTQSHKELFRQMQDAMFDTSDKYVGDPDSWYWFCIKLFASAFEEGVAQGVFKPMDTMKVAALFLDSINTLMSHRILTQVTGTIEEDVELMMDLYLNGLSQPS